MGGQWRGGDPGDQLQPLQLPLAQLPRFPFLFPPEFLWFLANRLTIKLIGFPPAALLPSPHL